MRKTTNERERARRDEAPGSKYKKLGPRGCSGARARVIVVIGDSEMEQQDWIMNGARHRWWNMETSSERARQNHQEN